MLMSCSCHFDDNRYVNGQEVTGQGWARGGLPEDRVLFDLGTPLTSLVIIHLLLPTHNISLPQGEGTPYKEALTQAHLADILVPRDPSTLSSP